MRPERSWLVPVVAALGLVACAPRPAAVAPAAAEAPTCRTGPDGGPPLADRGLGGTGAVSQVAERGIGGTGGPALADRGIGGTGIIGVITGFASVCLAGQEVALPPDLPVSVDSRPASADVLRAGQVIAVEARGDAARLQAARIAVRDEVSGPVELASGNRLRVLGQEVEWTKSTWGVRPRVGDWITVAGLRLADGAIEATRLDARAPGPVLLRGTLRETDGALSIGGQPIGRVPGLAGHVGEEVVVEGALVGGVLMPGGVTPDLLASDPAAFFGPAVGVVLVDGIATLENGQLRLGRAVRVPAGGLSFEGARRGVFRLERAGTGLRAVGAPGVAPGAESPRFEPAPMPDRSVRAPGGFRDGRSPGGSGRMRDRGRDAGFGRDQRPSDGDFGPAPGSSGGPVGGGPVGGGPAGGLTGGGGPAGGGPRGR